MSEYSNLVTPPNFPEEDFYSVLLVDLEWKEIDVIALFLKTVKESFNIYFYRPEMRDQDWLNKAVKKSDTIIVNTVRNENSEFKEKLICGAGAYYYGHVAYLLSEPSRRLVNPVDFFIQYFDKQESNSLNECS